MPPGGLGTSGSIGGLGCVEDVGQVAAAGFLGCSQCIEVALVSKAYEFQVYDVTVPCLYAACSPSSLLSFRNWCSCCGAAFVCKETLSVFIKSLSVTRISWCPISGV